MATHDMLTMTDSMNYRKFFGSSLNKLQHNENKNRKEEKGRKLETVLAINVYQNEVLALDAILFRQGADKLSKRSVLAR